MPEPFLYEQLDTLSQWGSIKKQAPDSVTQNLIPYQVETFARMFDRQMQKLQAQYEQIYLLRNKGHSAAFSNKSRRVASGFFCLSKRIHARQTASPPRLPKFSKLRKSMSRKGFSMVSYLWQQNRIKVFSNEYPENDG